MTAPDVDAANDANASASTSLRRRLKSQDEAAWQRSTYAGHPVAAGGTMAQQHFLRVPAEKSGDGDPSRASAEVRSVHQRALALIQTEFEVRTWQAFWRVTVDGCLPADAATALEMSPGAVDIAKSRVLRRLREELGDLVDE